MTYGSPGIPGALEQLRSARVRRLIVLPLYPQYSGSTTASVFDQVTSQLQRWRWVPELRFIGNYHDEPAYIDAIAASIREHWRTHERGHLLFSFHGVPRRYLLAGDPYHCQCLKTARPEQPGSASGA
jgi:ferrochelatase